MKYIIIVLTVLMSACGPTSRMLPAVPEVTIGRTGISGYEDIRYWGDDASADNLAQIEHMYTGAFTGRAVGDRRFDVLALSSGGAGGAFGAGLLVGWSERGTRPEFDLVTGVSTGAIIAPFAFLGPQSDAALEAFYTQTDRADIAQLTPLSALGGGAALTNSAPLRAQIEQVMTPSFVTRIAEQHMRGRRLLIGTTYLDAERSVVWDIGAIASSGQPDAHILIQRIILASSAIPAVFAPVELPVTTATGTYGEVHVDGAVSRVVFAYPYGIPLRRFASRSPTQFQDRNVFVILNTQVQPEYRPAALSVLSITRRSIDTLLKSQIAADIRRIEAAADRDGAELFLAAIPADFPPTPVTIFERTYMQSLFETGYRHAMGDSPWIDSSAGLLNPLN